MSRFLKERVAELSNISWPTKKQAVHTMIIVLTIMILVGIFLTGLDRIIASTFSYLTQSSEVSSVVTTPATAAPEIQVVDVNGESINSDNLTIETLDTDPIEIEVPAATDTTTEEPVTETPQ